MVIGYNAVRGGNAHTAAIIWARPFLASNPVKTWPTTARPVVATTMSVAIRRTQLQIAPPAGPTRVARACSIEAMLIPCATAGTASGRAIAAAIAIIALTTPIHTAAVARTLARAGAHGAIDACTSGRAGKWLSSTMREKDKGFLLHTL